MTPVKKGGTKTNKKPWIEANKHHPQNTYFLEKLRFILKLYCLENKLLLISINFTPKTSHSCLKNGTLGFPGDWKFP